MAVFSNFVATQGPFRLTMGLYTIDYIATNWNGATVTLQKLAPDGVTFISALTGWTINGSSGVATPAGLLLSGGQYQLLVSGGPPTAVTIAINGM